MKILVTGGAGFIGSAVVRQAIRDGHEVVNVDSLTYAACLANLTPIANAKGYVFEECSITDADAMARVFETHQPDAVMHLAAESHVDRSIDGPGWHARRRRPVHRRNALRAKLSLFRLKSRL